MKRTSMRRLWVGSLVAAGAAASASACSSEDPVLPTDPNPVVVTSVSPPPISGGTLLVTEAGLAIAADSDRDVIWTVDVATNKVESIALNKGDEPGRLALDGAGNLHVSLRGAGAVATIDLGLGRVTARTPVCSAPRGLAYDATTDAVHVACAGGELVSLPAAGGGPTRTLRIADRDLNDVIVQNGQLLVTRLRAAEVLVIGADGSMVNRQTPPLSDPTGFGNTFTPTVAWRSLPSAGGGLLMMHQISADAPVVISQPGGYGDTGNTGNGCDTTIVQSTISTFGGDGSSQSLPSPAIMGASVPVDLATDGSSFAIASAGSDSVFFVDQFTIQQEPGNPCTTGTQVAMPGQPVAVAYSVRTGFVTQIRELDAEHGGGAALVLATAGGADTVIKLTDQSVANTGHSLFHHNASSTSPLACASCHPQGHEDGHVWSFDTLGARRTQTVSGKVLETAPLHWNGDMSDLPDIMHEVFQHRMGGAEQGPRHVTAFGQWLNSIPAHPASPTGTTTQIANGKQIFERADVGCTTCHSGAHFTNNQTVDVGTGQAFQVPTLIGVGARRPYMHDGCAPDLHARFDPANSACNGGSQHGHTSQLSTNEVDDLVAYLESL